MPPFAPIKRKELIRQLRKLGFSGPSGRRKSSIYGAGKVKNLDS
jgi:hypothetical protein